MELPSSLATMSCRVGADCRPGRANAADRERGRRRPRLAEMRMSADRWRLQAAGRDQSAAPAFAGGAGEGRRRLLIGQSRARRGHCRPAAGHSGGDRDAVRCSAGEGRRHARQKARKSSSTIGAPRAAKRSRRGFPRRPEQSSCRASTIRRSSPGRARSGSRLSNSSARSPRADRHSLRRRRARVGDRACRAGR